MDLIEDYIQKNIKNHGTGSHEKLEEYKIINYPFDKYQIKIKLTSANEFIGIIEVQVNKEFLSYKQKLTSQGFVDVNEDYPE
jgi:hypothetical protein